MHKFWIMPDEHEQHEHRDHKITPYVHSALIFLLLLSGIYEAHRASVIEAKFIELQSNFDKLLSYTDKLSTITEKLAAELIDQRD